MIHQSMVHQSMINEINTSAFLVLYSRHSKNSWLKFVENGFFSVGLYCIVITNHVCENEWNIHRVVLFLGCLVLLWTLGPKPSLALKLTIILTFILALTLTELIRTRVMASFRLGRRVVRIEQPKYTLLLVWRKISYQAMKRLKCNLLWANFSFRTM